MSICRGLFIVFEGLDRSGKSSQCKRLYEHLMSVCRRNVKLIRCPMRDSPTGKLLSNYLTDDTCSISDEAVHLLFSANRWESSGVILEDLNAGVDVICDRYVYSGVAYSAAKGLDFEWCKSPDRNLPKPDVVFFLDVDPEIASKRGDYGAERYERIDFQKIVRKSFLKFQSSEKTYWKTIDANASVESIANQIDKFLSPILLFDLNKTDIEKLWSK